MEISVWEYFKYMTQNLLSNPETEKIYKQRKIYVEPVFGYLKAILSFTRMSLRGKSKVIRELGIALMTTNIRKNGSSMSYKEYFKNEIQWKFNFTNEFPLYIYFLEQLSPNFIGYLFI